MDSDTPSEETFEWKPYEKPADEWGLLITEHGRVWTSPPPDWQPPPPILPDDPREALPGLWDFAKLVWNEICQLWDDPASLLQQGYVSGLTYRRCCDWVRNLEGLVRRIVIVAALSLQLAPLKPTPPGEPPRPWGEPRFRRALWHDPSTWKVSFKMFPVRRGVRKRYARQRKPRREHGLPTAGLARRIEALCRVLLWKETYVARFARFMARVKAKNRVTNGDPREFHLAAWDFHWDRRTSGKYAVNEGMHPAQPLAERALALWNEPG